MPRKKASKDTQSPGLHQPTLTGFINSKSASMANPSANPQPTAKTTTPSKTPKAATSTTSKASPSKSPAKTTTTELEVGKPPAKRRSGNNRTQTKSPKKKAPARRKAPSDESDDDSDPGAFKAIRFESQEQTESDGSIEITSSDGDEEDEIISPSRPKRTATQKMRASSGSDSDVEVIGGSAGAPRGAKRRLKRRLMSSDEEDLTETEEEEPSPKKRRLVKGLKPSTSEEEIDLVDEVDEHRILDSRLRSRGKKTAFQRSLETLKRHRSGVSVDSPKASEEEDADEEDEPVPEPSHTQWNFFKPFAGARPSKKARSDEEIEEGDGSESKDEEEGEEGEDNWIVEDDGQEGVPELPMAFNMSSHQDLSHHFKIICQLFVHLAVRSPSQRASFIRDIKAAEDHYFYAALSTVRRKLTGMRDSLITSSTWQTKFKRVLEKYPVLCLMGMDFAVPGCDACNLGARMSKFIGRVSGQPYDRSTFEPIEDSDPEGDSDSDQSRDEDEEEKPKKQMHLGRFCAKRVESFHEFTHWEWKLFELLMTEARELRSTGKTGFVKVAFARGIQPPEDPDDADGIMDWLDQRGIITMAWTEMKQMIERAKKLESIGKKEVD